MNGLLGRKLSQGLAVSSSPSLNGLLGRKHNPREIKGELISLNGLLGRKQVDGHDKDRCDSLNGLLGRKPSLYRSEARRFGRLKRNCTKNIQSLMRKEVVKDHYRCQYLSNITIRAEFCPKSFLLTEMAFATLNIAAWG